MFSKIAVALDGSKSSLNALEYALHLAQRENAELILISAVEPIPPLASSPGGPPNYIPTIIQEMIESTMEMQKSQIERIEKSFPSLKVKGIVEEGRAATVISKYSKGSDLIVIGHRGQGGVLSWVLGSVAKELVDKCTVPVLVVKSKDYC